MIGTTYTVPPIPPDDAHTTYVSAGALSIGVEARELNEAELEAHYEGEAMDEIQAAKKTDVVEDNGVSIHVFGAEDGHEYLRFDLFEIGPHYHYIDLSGEQQTIVDFDRIAHGEMLDWALETLRHRLGPMLERAGGAALAAEAKSSDLEASLPEIESLARAAQERLGAQRSRLIDQQKGEAG